MKELIDGAYLRAVAFNADGATEKFYQGLRQRRLQSTVCKACGHIPFPPRPFCRACGSCEVEWVDMPNQGELYAWSQQERSLRFFKPDVLGLVRFPGIGFVFTRVAAPIESLRIGQKVVMDFLEVGTDTVLHQCRPIEEGGSGERRSPTS